MGLAALLVFSGIAALSMLMLVGMALNRKTPPTFAPTPGEPRRSSTGLVGPELFTIDATSQEDWRFFSFGRGTTVEPGEAGPLGWDLAFRRFQVIVNGGDGFFGSGGTLDLGEVSFEGVASVPSEGYVPNTVGSDTTNVVLEEWYSYSYFSHLLTPRPRVYAVRSADGRFAKVQFVGYYCPGAVPGCVTFRYAFQGDGTRQLAGD